MITPEAVLACHRHDLDYLGPLADGVATEAVLRSVSAEELAAHPLAYRPQRIKANDPRLAPYQGVWRPFTFEHAGRRVTDRVLVIWSAGKQRLDEQKRKTCLKRLLNDLAAIQKKLNTQRYKRRTYVQQRLVKVREGNPARRLVGVEPKGTDSKMQITFHTHHQRLAAAQALNGRYLIATNATHLDANQALTLFKGQDRVEKRFRDAKGPLVGRMEPMVPPTLTCLSTCAILSAAPIVGEMIIRLDFSTRGTEFSFPGNPPEPWYTVAASCEWLFDTLLCLESRRRQTVERSPQLQQTSHLALPT